jgi:hypothetical protein
MRINHVQLPTEAVIDLVLRALGIYKVVWHAFNRRFIEPY